MTEQKSDQGDVELTALDSFHSSPTGTVAARATFTTHRAHADELVKRGLAQETGGKKADPADTKKAPEPQNKKAPEPANKAAAKTSHK